MGKLKIFDDSGKRQTFDPSGNMTVTNVNSQHNTSLTIAQILSGVIVHTSTGSPGDVTLASAASIIAGANDAGVLKEVGDTITCYYVNDGAETLTFVAGTDSAIADDGQTLVANEASLLLFRRDTATTVKMYSIGG